MQLQKKSEIKQKQDSQLQFIIQEKERELQNLRKTVKATEEKFDHFRMEKETEKRSLKETIKELEKKKGKQGEDNLEDEFG